MGLVVAFDNTSNFAIVGSNQIIKVLARSVFAK